MAINYSLSYRTVKVADLDESGQKQYESNGELKRKAVQKAYATPQTIGTLSLDEFTRSCAANGAYSRADILSILTILATSIEDMLLLGQRIDLGDMGTFFPSISSKGVLDAKDFTPAAHIRRAYAGWTRSALMKKLKDVSYNLVNTKSAQAALNLASKGAQQSFTVNQSGSTQSASENLETLRSSYQMIVNVANGQTSYGSVIGEGTYKHGTYALIEAIPNDGYGFAGWQDGNEDNPRRVLMTSLRSMTASFYVKSGMVVNSITGADSAALHRGDSVTEIHITGADLVEDDIEIKGISDAGLLVDLGMSWNRTASGDNAAGKFTKSSAVVLDYKKLRVCYGDEPLFTIELPQA